MKGILKLYTWGRCTGSNAPNKNQAFDGAQALNQDTASFDNGFPNGVSQAMAVEWSARSAAAHSLSNIE
ncbi:MAG: hypothetical protein ABI262_13320 [Microcoleus sp.]